MPLKNVYSHHLLKSPRLTGQLVWCGAFQHFDQSQKGGRYILEPPSSGLRDTAKARRHTDGGAPGQGWLGLGIYNGSLAGTL